MYRLKRAARRAASFGAAALGLSATLLLCSCQNFFVCQKASCPSSGSGTGTATGDYVYVSNSTSGTTYIAGYDIGNGSLAALSGSPYNLDYVPVAMSVSPNDDFLYIASVPGATNPGIYLYTLTSGVPAIANSGTVLITASVSSMDISSDGNYLFALSTSGTLLTEYLANSSTGALTPVTSIILPGTTCTLAGTPISQTCTVKVSPSGDFVAVALGTAGTAIFPYTSSSGITSSSYTLISPPSATTATGDYSVAFDANNYAYIASTATLTSFAVTSSTITQGSTATFSSSAVPRSVVLSTSYDDVYTANEGASTISAYTVGTNGLLTALSGSPFTGPTNVSALGADKSGSYLVAAGYNSSSGVQLFSLSSGALTLVTSAGTGTSTAYPVVLAMSH